MMNCQDYSKVRSLIGKRIVPFLAIDFSKEAICTDIIALGHYVLTLEQVAVCRVFNPTITGELKSEIEVCKAPILIKPLYHVIGEFANKPEPMNVEYIHKTGRKYNLLFEGMFHVDKFTLQPVAIYQVKDSLDKPIILVKNLKDFNDGQFTRIS